MMDNCQQYIAANLCVIFMDVETSGSICWVRMFYHHSSTPQSTETPGGDGQNHECRCVFLGYDYKETPGNACACLFTEQLVFIKIIAFPFFRIATLGLVTKRV